MNDNNATIPRFDGALFNLNVRNFPEAELLKYADQHVAWSLDGTQILASGKDHAELERNLAAKGLQQGSFVEDYVPGPNAYAVLQ
jgi:hypothetical protein